MRRPSRTFVFAAAASVILTGLIASPVAADGTAPTLLLGMAPVPGSDQGQVVELSAADEDGLVVQLSCDNGVLSPASVTGLPAATTGTFGLLVPFDLAVTCTAADDDGNVAEAVLGPFSRPAPPAPVIVVGLPEPDPTRWFIPGPVVGELYVFNPSPNGPASVSALSCTGAELGDLEPGLPSASVSASLTVTSEGITEVSCTATNTNGRQATGIATVRIDAPTAGDQDPADGIADALQPTEIDAFAFRDASTATETLGRLVNANGLSGRVTDAADPGTGVLVTVDPAGPGRPGPGPVELEACGSTVLVPAGSAIEFTCASIIVTPLSGSVQVVLDTGDLVTVRAGSSVEIDDTDQGVTLTGLSGEDGGVSVTTSGGETIPVPVTAGAFNYPDTSPPTVSVQGATAPDELPLPTYTLGAEPTLTCSATDTGSGLDGGCEGSLAGGRPNGVGTFTYTATARDRAGNQATASYRYRVVYRMDGFLPPINDPRVLPNRPQSVFKAGWIVPVIFQIKRADGSTVAPAEPPKWISPIKGGPLTGAPNEPEPDATATTGDTFKRLGGLWYYNWRTKGLVGGSSYRIGVALDDGTVRTVVVGLR